MLKYQKLNNDTDIIFGHIFMTDAIFQLRRHKLVFCKFNWKFFRLHVDLVTNLYKVEWVPYSTIKMSS